MTETDYRALPGLTATDLKAGAVSMRHMRASVKGELRKESPSLAWGSIVHAAILEPERFWQGVATWQGEAKRGKEWTEFKAANEARTILDAEETGMLERLIDSVYSNPEAARLIEGSEHEVLQRFEGQPYGLGKARLDGLAERYFIELKTARAVDKRRFASQFYGLGYDIQVGWYSIPVPGRLCFVIAAESAPPYDCIVYQVPSEVVKAGQERAIEIAARYRASESAGIFNGVDEGAWIVEFVPPAWAGGKGEWTVGEATEGSAEV
jgi:hypothetical protein